MKTLKIRIKDSSQTKLLCQLASEVNLVWNYCNELGFKYLQRTGKFLSAYDIDKLTKTKMAKSVNDTGFSAFKTMLKYKCENAGTWFVEVSENYTTQICSCCGEISANSPKGRANLGIREWTCAKCGTWHDRDVNASKNILRLGHQTLAGGIPSL